MNEGFMALMDMLKSGGWIAFAGFAAYMVYKLSMVSVIATAIYKSLRLLIVSFSSKALENRIASELGTKAPLTAGEEAFVLRAVRDAAKVASRQGQAKD